MQYDEIAEQYAAGISQDLDERKLAFETKELTGIHHPTNWHVLDIGCGSGIQIEYLANQFPEIAQLDGIDGSAKLIEIAKSNNKDPRCTYRVGDMHALPFPDDTFDFIYSRYTIHYSSEMDNVMQEMFRVSKVGGQSFIQVVHPTFELFKKNSRDYASPEKAIFTPQTSKVKVVHVTHTVAEYVNASILAGFSIQNIEERFGRQSEISGFRVPTILILRVVKQ